MTQYDTTARLLKARLEELTNRINKIEDDLRQPLDADSEEQAIDLQDDETLEALESAGQAEVAAIHAALERIANGSYGTCVTCGDAIAPARLTVQPTAAQCIKCAKD